MLIIKSNEITIPRGISPSFTRSGDEKLQSKKITITKNGVSNIYPDSGYYALDSVSITTNVQPNLENIVKNYTANGKYTISKSAKYDGIGNAVINIQVPEKEIKLQSKSLNVAKNGSYTVDKDSSYDGMSSVSINVNIPEKKINLQNKTITENGSVSADPSYDGLGTVTVNVPIPEYKSQVKEVSYSNNGSFIVKPDETFDGISQVSIDVNVPIPEYKSEEKTVTYTANGDYSLTPSKGNDGISKAAIKVNVPSKEPNLEEQIINSSDLKSYVKGAQVFVTPHDGYDALSKVTINKLTFEGKSPVTPKTTQQVISPSAGYDGFNALTINAVDSTIDSNIKASNIKKGVSILGIEGTYDNYVAPKTQEKTIASSELINNTTTETPLDITPDETYDGLSKVSLTKVNLLKTLNVDVKFPSDNKYSIVKFGSYNGVQAINYKTHRQSKTVDASSNSITVTPDSGYVGLSSVVVNPIEYVPLKYIQSDGACAYVLDSSALAIEGFPKSYDTYHPMYRNDLRCEISFTPDVTAKTSNYYGIINGYSYDDNNTLKAILDVSEEKIIVRDIQLSTYKEFSVTEPTITSTQYDVIMDLKQAGNSTIYTNDAYALAGTSFTFSSSSDIMMLFASDYTTADTFAYDDANPIKIHNVRLTSYTDGTKADVNWNFIPVLYKGQPGFLETNSGTFCKNLGTGTPIYELL